MNNLERSEASAKRRHLFPGGRRRLIALAPPLLSLQVFLTIFIYFLLQVQGNHGRKTYESWVCTANRPIRQGQGPSQPRSGHDGPCWGS